MRIVLNDIVCCKSRQMATRARCDNLQRDRTSDCNKRAHLFIVTCAYKQIQGRTGADCGSQCLHAGDYENKTVCQLKGRAEQSSSVSFIGLFSHDPGVLHSNAVKVGHDVDNETLQILFLT
jgi:hypothetical protein